MRGEGGGWAETGVGIGWGVAAGGEGDVAGRPCGNNEETWSMRQRWRFKIHVCEMRRAFACPPLQQRTATAHAAYNSRRQLATFQIKKTNSLGDMFFFRLLLFSIFLKTSQKS